MHASNAWHCILDSGSSKTGSHQLVSGLGKSIKKCKKHSWVLLQVALNHALFRLYRLSPILYSIPPFDHTPCIRCEPLKLHSMSSMQTRTYLSSLGVSKQHILTSQRSTQCNTTLSWSSVLDCWMDSILRVLSDCTLIMLRKLTMQATKRSLSPKWQFGCADRNPLIISICILTGKRQSMMC